MKFPEVFVHNAFKSLGLKLVDEDDSLTQVTHEIWNIDVNELRTKKAVKYFYQSENSC